MWEDKVITHVRIFKGKKQRRMTGQCPSCKRRGRVTIYTDHDIPGRMWCSHCSTESFLGGGVTVASCECARCTKAMRKRGVTRKHHYYCTQCFDDIYEYPYNVLSTGELVCEVCSQKDLQTIAA